MAQTMRVHGGGESVGSGPVGLHLKVMLTGEFFITSGTWLTLEGNLTRVNKMPKHQK